MTSLKSFNLTKQETDNQIEIVISGYLDEQTRFPEISGNKPVLIEFGAVSLMNSYAIKAWCVWGNRHQHLPIIRIEKAPFLFIKNCSLMSGFLVPNMQLQSFFVPYFSEATQESKNVLLVAGVNYTKDGLILEPEVLDSKGARMEIDVDISSSIQFLK